LWNKTYGGGSASSVVQTSDGGYALAGASHLVKTDGSGNMQWSKTYGGTDYVDVRSVVQTSDGGYALAGSTICFGVDSSDAWLVKTDGSGNAQWRKTYGGTQDDFVNCGIQTSDSGYALAGRTVSFGAGDEDFYFVKTDSNLSPIHDVVVTNVYPSKTVVGEPSICMLNVTVVNRGDFIESFNITAWATIAPLITSIQNVSILNLSPDETRTVTILWNNTGWAYGNYAVSAYAEPVPGETEIADNIFADGTVIVTIPGDVDGDSNVGILDVVKITSCYGKKLGDTLYNPNADIDGNGVINILDVAICTGHYGQK
jgi:hypothetical protein